MINFFKKFFCDCKKVNEENKAADTEMKHGATCVCESPSAAGKNEGSTAHASSDLSSAPESRVEENISENKAK